MLLVVLLVGVTGSQARDQQLSGDLKDLISSEKSFAATCAEKGIRDSFLMYFADDVVTVGSDLRHGKEHLEKRANTEPLRLRLQWLPVYGDIAKAGDLGYLTGPSLLEDQKGEQSAWHGQYLSIWRKGKDGWKVAVDFGVTAPTAVFKPNAGFQLAPQAREAPAGATGRSSSGDSLITAEGKLHDTAAAKGDRASVCALAESSIRYYQDQEVPQEGKASLCASSGADPAREYKMLGHEISASEDLGYAYGEFRSVGIPSAKQTRGVYLHVWKRDGEGNWRMVAVADKFLGD